jgi:hypothetical protein
MDKVVTSAPAAMADMGDGSVLAVGRYGLAPQVTLDEVRPKFRVALGWLPSAVEAARCGWLRQGLDLGG